MVHQKVKNWEKLKNIIFKKKISKGNLPLRITNLKLVFNIKVKWRRTKKVPEDIFRISTFDTRDGPPEVITAPTIKIKANGLWLHGQIEGEMTGNQKRAWRHYPNFTMFTPDIAHRKFYPLIEKKTRSSAYNFKVKIKVKWRRTPKSA